MSEKNDKDTQVEYSDQVINAMGRDPKLAAAVRDFAAILRQVGEGLKTGQYKSWDEGVEILTGSKPEPIDLDDEEPNG